MKLAMIGLGRMGANMAKRLIAHGHEVVAYDRDPEAVAAAVSDGAQGASSLEELVDALEPPRVAWVMVPSGEPTRMTVEELSTRFDAGDVIVDGGNSRYHDAQAFAAALGARGVAFLDAGVSGGVWGLENGYCLMVGGDAKAVEVVRPAFEALAPPDGFAHVGPSGAGHFTKMVHNGIEYGMLQAYAEGFALLEAADELNLDLHQVAALWNHGSVIRSWLLELSELALQDPGFARVKGWVEDSGEGRWTVEESVQRAVATPVITASLYARFSSRQPDSFAARIVAALRNQFGGHALVSESAAAEHAAEIEDRTGDSEVIAGPEASGTTAPTPAREQ